MRDAIACDVTRGRGAGGPHLVLRVQVGTRLEEGLDRVGVAISAGYSDGHLEPDFSDGSLGPDFGPDFSDGKLGTDFSDGNLGPNFSDFKVWISFSGGCRSYSMSGMHPTTRHASNHYTCTQPLYRH